MELDTLFESKFGEFTTFKRKSELISNISRESLAWRNKALNVELCNKQFGVFEDGEIYGNFCRERICPLCQRRKSIKTWSELKQTVDVIGGQWLLATFTVRNVGPEKLENAIQKLYLKFSEIWREELKNRFCGAFRTLEITYNQQRDDYHPHLHVIISVDDFYFKSARYITQSELLTLWRLKFGNSDGGVDIRKIDNVESGVAEVAKYAVKPFNYCDEKLTLKMLDELFSRLKNRRLTQSYGNVKTVLSDIKKEYHAQEKQDAHDCKTWYSWDKEKGNYFEM